MTSLLFASKAGAIGAKFLTGAAIAKAAPIVVPVACAVVCVGVTIAGVRYLTKKPSSEDIVSYALPIPIFNTHDNKNADDKDSPPES
ncbi:MAG: hypothetical protein FWC16_01905 [Defluviitaleaceae bacterium]|nr:hypothetical protein [Defluviitaleaceae bacterium]MCL2273653.1 hypothetical protein [Defluviitaleaceae bacterium]